MRKRKPVVAWAVVCKAMKGVFLSTADAVHFAQRLDRVCLLSDSWTPCGNKPHKVVRLVESKAGSTK